MGKLMEILVIPLLAGCLALVIVLGIINISGCSNRTDNFETKYVEGIKVIKIDGCEYLENGYSLTHKGNCSNPIHNKE